MKNQFKKYSVLFTLFCVITGQIAQVNAGYTYNAGGTTSQYSTPSIDDENWYSATVGGVASALNTDKGKKYTTPSIDDENYYTDPTKSSTAPKTGSQYTTPSINDSNYYQDPAKTTVAQKYSTPSINDPNYYQNPSTNNTGTYVANSSKTGTNSSYKGYTYQKNGSTGAKYTTPSINDPNYYQPANGSVSAKTGLSNTGNTYVASSTGTNGTKYQTPSIDDCNYYQPCTKGSVSTPTGSTSTSTSTGSTDVVKYQTPDINDCNYYQPCTTGSTGTNTGSGSTGGVKYHTPDINDCNYYQPCTTGTTVSQCNDHKYPKDIDGHWAEIYVRRMYDLCIVEGYQDGTYRPDQNVSRAELVKMALFGAKKSPKAGCYDADCGTPFIDLDTWQGPWIRAAYDLGIIKGYSANQFRPNQAITRAEATKIILAAYGYSPSNVSKSFFNDVEGWATGWIERAHELGIVQGIGNGNFDPERPITRAEAAKIIAKSIEQEDTKID